MPGKDNIVVFFCFKLKPEILWNIKACLDEAQTNILKTQFVALLPELKLKNKIISDIGLIDLINYLVRSDKTMRRKV
jgi:hypothetical protein